MKIPMFCFLLLGAVSLSVTACPASYVKSVADSNQGTALHDKATQVADKYMSDRGMDPSSAAGEVAKPYVIGTALVEHGFSSSFSQLPQYNQPGDRIDLNEDTVDEATQKALGQHAGQAGVASSDGNGHGLAPAWHHFNRHFSYGIYLAGELTPTKAVAHGG
ncbi:MAG: hypothetical protein QF752_17225 [Planctomycetota bacterium]|jgi:hypothetical protein|nr:hypothetical protein [Planctomycetota bacterium]